MKELIVVIAILAIAFVVYLFIGGGDINFAGIINALNFSFPTIKTQSGQAQPMQAEKNQNPPAEGNTGNNTYNPGSSSQSYQEENENTGNSQTNNSQETNQSQSQSPLSPYYQQIRISGVKGKTGNNPSLITLRTNTKEEINITGFKIKTRHGEFVIPQGEEKYQLYRSGKDIVIDANMYIYVVGGKSPLDTQGFRINECFGYLKNYSTFYPSFYSYCPTPSKENLYSLLPICQDYILKLPRCKTPNYSDSLAIATNSGCTGYINENLNYSGCFKNYSNDDNFLKNYWYLYTKSDIVEPLHDIVYLYDSQGYLVNKYSF